MTFLQKVMCCASLLLIANAQASVVLGGTRIIYPSNKSEVQITLKNKDSHTRYLVQSWVSNINESKAPFIITPPVYKLDENRQTLLHVVFTGAKSELPTDRESLFLANVKSVSSLPAELEDKNTLQFAMKTRIKLFWRPTTLDSTASLVAWEKVTFRKDGASLVAKNPTPFYVSFADLSVGGKEVKPTSDKTVPEALSMMIAPFSEQRFTLPAGSSGKVTWSAINDFGANTEKHEQNI